MQLTIQLMLRTESRIPLPLTPCSFHLSASFTSRLANTDDIDRPIYGLSAQLLLLLFHYQTLKRSLKYIGYIVDNNINILVKDTLGVLPDKWFPSLQLAC